MPSLQQVKDQIKMLDGTNLLFVRREINELPNILWENESITGLISGTYHDHQGILVATSKRLIFVDKGLISRLRVEDFSYDKISSIEYQTGVLFGKITIYASGNKSEITYVPKDQVRVFGENVRARINSLNTQPASPMQSATAHSTDEILSLLERLAKLKEQGVLSEEEFQVQKDKILAR